MLQWLFQRSCEGNSVGWGIGCLCIILYMRERTGNSYVCVAGVGGSGGKSAPHSRSGHHAMYPVTAVWQIAKPGISNYQYQAPPATYFGAPAPGDSVWLLLVQIGAVKHPAVMCHRRAVYYPRCRCQFVITIGIWQEHSDGGSWLINISAVFVYHNPSHSVTQLIQHRRTAFHSTEGCRAEARLYHLLSGCSLIYPRT